jgi:hypothetical protein
MQVAENILHAPGGDAYLVMQVFEKLLDRPADEGGMNYWVARLQSGLSDEAFFASVASSPEYGLLATSKYYDSASDSKWISQMFLDALGRPVDSGSLAYFINKLRIGTRRIDVALEIGDGPEAHRREVTLAFNSLIGFIPDQGMFDNLVSSLGAGGSTIEQVKAQIMGLPQYLAKTDGSNEGFLAAVFQDALGRQLDDPGRSFYLPQLNGGVSPETVALSILSSPEANRHVTTLAYSNLLRRTVDGGGLSYWSSLLAVGVRDEEVFASIMVSPEYYGVANR